MIEIGLTHLHQGMLITQVWPGPLWAGHDKENQFPLLSDGGACALIAVWEEKQAIGLEVTVLVVLLSLCSYMTEGMARVRKREKDRSWV